MTDLLVVFPLLFSPLWVPLAFIAYAFYRRQFSIGFLFIVLTAEAASLGVAKLTLWMFSNPAA